MCFGSIIQIKVSSSVVEEQIQVLFVLGSSSTEFYENKIETII